MLFTPDVQNSLHKSTSCLVTVVKEDFLTRFCDPYVFVAGTRFDAVDRAVSIIQKEID